MKTLNLIASMLFLLISCSSIDLPDSEETKQKINGIDAKLSLIDKNIDKSISSSKQANDIVLTIKKNMLNKIFKSMAYDKSRDVIFKFLATKPFLKEDKNVLGIEYTNYINIDSGFVNLNLKKFIFNSMQNNLINATIELEGKGFIALTGKNTGISASVESDVSLYLNDEVSIKLLKKKNGKVNFAPVEKPLILKTKFSINIAGWKIPWKEEIEMDLSDILNEIELPINFTSDVELPFPEYKSNRMDIKYKKYKVVLKNVNPEAKKDQVVLKSDIDLIR